MSMICYIECCTEQEIFASIQNDDIFVPLARFEECCKSCHLVVVMQRYFLYPIVIFLLFNYVLHVAYLIHLNLPVRICRIDRSSVLPIMICKEDPMMNQTNTS
jgi:hypothetical protein